MKNEKSTESANAQVCPYLHQLDVDWLAMSAEGLYCHDENGDVKMLSEQADSAMCALPNFTYCPEYQFLEATTNDNANISPPTNKKR